MNQFTNPNATWQYPQDWGYFQNNPTNVLMDPRSPLEIMNSRLANEMSSGRVQYVETPGGMHAVPYDYTKEIDQLNKLRESEVNQQKADIAKMLAQSETAFQSGPQTELVRGQAAILPSQGERNMAEADLARQQAEDVRWSALDKQQRVEVWSKLTPEEKKNIIANLGRGARSGNEMSMKDIIALLAIDVPPGSGNKQEMDDLKNQYMFGLLKYALSGKI